MLENLIYFLCMIRSFKDLEVYQISVDLYPRVVEVSKRFPPVGFHLRDQLCRAANSTTANIVEGFGRSVAEFKMYLTRALGSCNEATAHLEMAVKSGFISKELFDELYEQLEILGKKIYTLRKNWK
jgi:four helix bundle protein